MTNAAHLKAIHTLKTRAGLQEEDFRTLLVHHTGKHSSRELSDGSAVRFIEVLRGHAGAGGARPRADRATGPFAPVLQALWLSAWHLAIVGNRSDTAMMAFVKRQTGLDHTRFLLDPADANRAIEGLKAWLAREGGVVWPGDPRDGLGRKRAVVEAIARRLVAAGGFTAFLSRTAPWPLDFEAYGASRSLPASFDAYRDADWITLMGWLGESLRAALALHRPKGGTHD